MKYIEIVISEHSCEEVIEISENVVLEKIGVHLNSSALPLQPTFIS